MTKEVFESLVSSIRTMGQQEPITVNEKGTILDGHHRLRACNKLNLRPSFKIKSFENSLEEKLFVIDVNLQRRQLTMAQRVQLCLKKKPILQELARLNQSLGGRRVQICTPLGRVNELVAKDSGVSARQVSKIETILTKADDRLRSRVLSGQTTVDRAYNQIKAEEKREQLISQARRVNPELATRNELLQCDIFEGDFREIAHYKLSNDSIDLIFTDPPYGENSVPLYANLAKMASRVLKEGSSLVTYVGQYALNETLNAMLLPENGLMYWWIFAVEHTGGQTQIFPRKVSACWKPLVWLIKGKKLCYDLPQFIDDHIESSPPDKTLHEWAQSPVEAKHIIKHLTQEGHTILDPFLGQGTTALAAMQLKRRFIGFDNDAEAIKSAKANLTLNFAAADDQAIN